MSEVCSGNNKGNRILAGIRSGGGLLWDGFCRNVRSSVTLSVNVESSIALVCLYAIGGYAIASALGVQV